MFLFLNYIKASDASRNVQFIPLTKAENLMEDNVKNGPLSIHTMLFSCMPQTLGQVSAHTDKTN